MNTFVFIIVPWLNCMSSSMEYTKNVWNMMNYHGVLSEMCFGEAPNSSTRLVKANLNIVHSILFHIAICTYIVLASFELCNCMTVYVSYSFKTWVRGSDFIMLAIWNSYILNLLRSLCLPTIIMPSRDRYVFLNLQASQVLLCYQ